jgi:hypothetical protein
MKRLRCVVGTCLSAMLMVACGGGSGLPPSTTTVRQLTAEVQSAGG